MNRREVEELIQSSHDACLTAGQEEELANLLRDSEEAREIWCEHSLLVSDLRRYASNSLSRPGSIPPSASYAAARQRRRNITGSIAAAAAVLAVGAWVLAEVLVDPNKDAIALSISSGSLLMANDGQPFFKDHLTTGDTVKIRQGTVRLDFPSGVTGILEGPALLTLESPSHLRFSAGRGHFHVPPDARGFTVTGPTMEVIDLGTEFGVDFREANLASTSVFKGRVEIRALFGRRESLQLTAGHAVRLSPIGIFDPTPSLGHFATSLPDALPEINIDFNRIEDNTIPFGGTLPGADEYSARIVSDDPHAAHLVPGIVGSALEFSGDAELISDWPGIHGDAPRTVALWFRLHPDGDYRSAPPLALWGQTASNLNRKFKVAVVTEEDGQTLPRVSLGKWYINGSTHVADGKWHHLAATWDGNDSYGSPRIQLFLDGSPERVSYQNHSGLDLPSTDTLSPAARPFSIGHYELPAPVGTPYFRGSIDELRIVAGVLTAQEIRHLAERDQSTGE